MKPALAPNHEPRAPYKIRDLGVTQILHASVAAIPQLHTPGQAMQLVGKTDAFVYEAGNGGRLRQHEAVVTLSMSP